MHRVLTAGLLAALSFPLAAAGAADWVPLEQRLSAEQLRQTGLDTLTAEQLARLNELLRDDQGNVVREVREQARRERIVRDTSPVTSTIDGTIRGWSAGTVFTLANGQRWRVTQGDLFLRKPVENPAVEIAPSAMGAWLLQIPGQNQRAKVERLD